MQKRSEASKEVKIMFRMKLKRTVITVFCIMFAYSAIYAVDISTNKLLASKEDTYALRVSNQQSDTLRVDLAGSRYDLDISQIKLYLKDITDKAKNMIGEDKNP